MKFRNYLKVLKIYFDIRALEQILGRIPFLLRFVLVFLSGFFVVKNFKMIYSKLREYL